MTLESQGAAVEMSSSSEDAWNTVRRKRPDLLIADIGMPQEDGYVLIQRLRQYERESSEQRLPAIALTAYASSAHRDQALAFGYDVHIGKPVLPGELIRTVGRFRKAANEALGRTEGNGGNGERKNYLMTLQRFNESKASLAAYGNSGNLFIHGLPQV